MAQMIPRLQAEESLRFANTLRIAGAAAGIVSAMSKKAAESAINDYQRFTKGLEAQLYGTVGQEVDRHGRPILRSANDIRKWFYVEGGLHV